MENEIAMVRQLACEVENNRLTMREACERLNPIYPSKAEMPLTLYLAGVLSVFETVNLLVNALEENRILRVLPN